LIHWFPTDFIAVNPNPVFPRFILFLGTLQSLSFGQVGTPDSLDRAWNEEVIYFVLTDRFFDGDPGNNRPDGSDPDLYDPTQSSIDLYHGGDFRGLELALQSGYFNELGVTAIWITPPVRNTWYSEFDSADRPKTGYHGYGTQDFRDIDPHLVSDKSLDGSFDYPNTREGRLAHYRDLVDLAHSKGIKIIQDIVCNHVGPVFYYDSNRNQRFDLMRKEEWIQPFMDEGFHPHTRWADEAEWNLLPTRPTQSVELFGRKVEINDAFADFSTYGRKGFSPDSLTRSNGEEVVCDFLSLRDFWTAPDSAHFEELVDNFVEIYAFYIETIGVDGLRIDTVKHVHHKFWDAFTERLRERIGPETAREVILFGEVYDGSPEALGRYTYRADWPASEQPSIDSLLNFQFCYAVRDYLRTGDDSFGTARGVADALQALQPTSPPGRMRPYFNQTPGPDGLNASEKTILFAENHDGINRFRVRGVSARRNLLANALALTLPGIPCLYYGTEAALHDTEAGVDEDAETGRMTFVPRKDPGSIQAVRRSEDFRNLANLIDLRKRSPALTSQATHPLWIDLPRTDDDDGIFAFLRGRANDEPILVVVNASDRSATTSGPDTWMRLTDASGIPFLKKGRSLEAIPWESGPNATHRNPRVNLKWEEKVPFAKITAPPENVLFFRVVDKESSMEPTPNHPETP